MTEAHSTNLMSESDLSDDLDSFVSLAMATADLIWAASDHDGIGADSIGKVAYNLSNDAFQLRGRLDRQHEKRMEQIYKERPELLEEGPSHDNRLSEIMWKRQQIEAMFRGIQSLNGDGTSPDADAMDTLAGIARPMINEIRDLADDLGGVLGTTEGGAS